MQTYTPPEFKISFQDLIKKNTVVYGGTGSGKTTIIDDILNKLNGHIDICIVFSGSEIANGNYKKRIPEVMIHTDIRFANSEPQTKKKIKESEKIDAAIKLILNRQELNTQVYANANKHKNILSLFKLTSRRIYEDAMASINSAERKKDRIINSIKHMDCADTDKPAYINRCNEAFRVCIIKHMKRAIVKDRDRIMKSPKLSDEERYALNYIDLNPNLLIIFDDMADVLKTYADKVESLKTLFYKGRHYSITSLISCQSHNDLPPNLRANAHISIFTSRTCATGFFNNTANAIGEDVKRIAEQVIPRVFCAKGTPNEYRKLVYEKDNIHPFQHYTAVCHGKFRFGSDEYWAYCESIKRESFDLKKSNEFHDIYKI